MPINNCGGSPKAKPIGIKIVVETVGEKMTELKQKHTTQKIIGEELAMSEK